MYGFISNNLQTQINKYLETKLIDITYKHNTPINSIEKILKEVNVNNLIIDTTCFYDDQVVIDFCYQLKILKPKIRIIVICFNTHIITEIAMLGIYDVIDYQKKINLSNELDEILLNPKNLSDLQMYLNTDIIRNKGNNCKIIGALSYESNSYLTTFLLNYCQIYKDEKVCYCETPNTKTSLVNYFGASNYANYTNYGNEKFKYLDVDMLFCNNPRIKKDAILTLLLNLRNKYDVLVFDLGSMPMVKNNEEIISNCDEIIIFKSDNIYNSYHEYDELFHNKITNIINYKELYEKNVVKIESDVIKNYIDNNFRAKQKGKVNFKMDIKNVALKIKEHIKSNEQSE